MADKENRIKEIYQKYAPKNLSFAKFEEMVKQNPSLLDDINGNFSTFNPELAVAMKAKKAGKMSTKDAILKLQDSMDDDAMDKVVNKYAEMYADIVTSDDEILQYAVAYDILGPSDREKLGRKIIDELTKRYMLKKKPKLTVFDMHVIAAFVRNFLKGFTIKHSKYLQQDSDQLTHGKFFENKKHIVMLNDHFRSFASFMETLSHEYGHFVDHNNPDLGMLGAQIAAYGEELYTTENKLYIENPTEISSFAIGEAVENRLSDILNEQLRQKPDLYTQATKRFLPKAKIRMKALRLKYYKEIKNLETVQQKYLDTISEILEDVKKDGQLTTQHSRLKSDIQEIESLINTGDKYNMGSRVSAIHNKIYDITRLMGINYQDKARKAHDATEQAITDEISTYYLLAYDVAHREQDLAEYEQQKLQSGIQREY